MFRSYLSDGKVITVRINRNYFCHIIAAVVLEKYSPFLLTVLPFETVALQYTSIPLYDASPRSLALCPARSDRFIPANSAVPPNVLLNYHLL